MSDLNSLGRAAQDLAVLTMRDSNVVLKGLCATLSGVCLMRDLAGETVANPRKLSDEELQQRFEASPHFKALMESYWRYVARKGGLPTYSD